MGAADERLQGTGRGDCESGIDLWLSEEVRAENCSDFSHIVQSCGRTVHKFYGIIWIRKVSNKSGIWKGDDMMDKLKKNMVFYLLLLIDFYIVPWFIKDTGSAMIVMLVIIPLICLITSVFYGIRNGFNFWYILIVAIMFAPSIFIFYNSSAWVYVVGYAVIALLGNLIALPLRKR